jgi:hypothetical protein
MLRQRRRSVCAAGTSEVPAAHVQRSPLHMRMRMLA